MNKEKPDQTYQELLEELAHQAGLLPEQVHPVTKGFLEKLSANPTPENLRDIVDALNQQSQSYDPNNTWNNGRARLVTIANDGSDGDPIWIQDDAIIIGREAMYNYPDDDFLSPKHVEISWEGDALVIADLGSINGTFIKAQGKLKLKDGDVFLCGRQIIKFMVQRSDLFNSPENKDSQEGTRRIASPLEEDRYTLALLGVGDAIYEMHHIGQQPTVLGREPTQEGDHFSFPDDKYLSSDQAKISRDEDGDCILEDLDSGNGTWIKLTKRRELKQDDFIFLGKQLFRVEFPPTQG